MWLFILFHIAFVNVKVLVGSLQENSKEDPKSWTHIIFTMTRKLVWPTLNFPPTLIGLFSVVTKNLRCWLDC